MKIGVVQDISNVDSWEDLRRFSAQVIGRLVDAVNGKLNFSDNIESSFVNITFGSANATVSGDHGLGKAPSGYIVTKRSASITVFDGASPNTDRKIYVQASGAGTVTLLVF